jgi:hypothetical protein
MVTSNWPFCSEGRALHPSVTRTLAHFLISYCFPIFGSLTGGFLLTRLRLSQTDNRKGEFGHYLGHPFVGFDAVFPISTL